MNWGRLLAWSDNIIAANSDFPPHAHKDMEIITYFSHGAITHEDNSGNKGRTVAGDVQVMSAGTGIAHSEYNLEPDITKTFQIWIQPDQSGMPPSWGTRPFPKGASAGRFVTLARVEWKGTQTRCLSAVMHVFWRHQYPGSAIEGALSTLLSSLARVYQLRVVSRRSEMR